MNSANLTTEIEVLRAAIKQFKGEVPHQPPALPANHQCEPSAIVGYMESQLDTKLNELAIRTGTK